MHHSIHLIGGDITKAEVDVIVNAANSKMLGGGGVDGAIHRAAGPDLLEACRQVSSFKGIRCPVGEARITPAGKLKAKYVVHTVGPRYGIDEPADALLQSAYHNSFRLASEHQCKSIALPAVSCGVYGFPIERAGEIAFAEAEVFAEHFEQIDFYLMPQRVFEAWQAIAE